MTTQVTTTHLVRTSKVRRWKRSPEFRERMAQVLQQVAEFQPAEVQLVMTVDAGDAEFEPNGVSVSEHGSAV